MKQPFDKTAIGLRALWRDMSEAPGWLPDECESMIEQLDLFVHDELNGLDVRARHPRVWGHLQLCADCRAEHDSLLDLLIAEERGLLAPLPSEPPRLSPALIPRPWRLVIENLPGQSRPALLFLFAPTHLQRSLRPAAGIARRGEAVLGYETLLLSYLGDPGTGEIMVQMYARPSPGSGGNCNLALVATGEPMPSAVTLTWGDQTWTAQLGPNGDAELGPVPMAALATAPADSAAFSLRLLP